MNSVKTARQEAGLQQLHRASQLQHKVKRPAALLHRRQRSRLRHCDESRKCCSSTGSGAEPAVPPPAQAAGDVEGGRGGTVPGQQQSSPQPDGSADLSQQKGIQEMLMFAVPALGMCLADPLMTLIDTACVGHISAVQLAALGPNTAIFNFTFQLFAFLGVATTSTIAASSPHVPSLTPEERATRRHNAQSTLSTSLSLAAACGTLVGGLLLARGPALLASMGTPAEVVAPALQYLRIRALAAPAAMLMNVCQGACLGQQDAWTPFTVLAAAALLNTAGDIYLIAYRGGGVAGAAAATAAAQWVGAAYFLWHLWRKGKQEGGIPLRFMGLPQWEAVQPFLEVASTLFGRTIFGMAAYFSMTVVATRLGTLSTAAHQVAMQVFWFLSYFPEPLSLAAQSLIARDRYAPRQAAQWAHLLLRAGAVLGLGLAAVLAGIFTGGSWVFTKDVAVQQVIAGLTPIAALVTVVCSVMMMFDGISIGAGDFKHMPVANAVGLGTTLAVLWVGRRAGIGLFAVWWALVGFYSTRLTAHLVHYVARGKASVFAGDSRQGKARAAAAGA